VVAFHGLGQRASAFAAQTGLVGATRAVGEVLVLPESHGPAFNDGRLGGGGPRDDMFTLAVIGQLTGRGWVDPGRVTVAGYSNGAGMAMAVAATHPDAVAAVVSIDGELIAAPGAPRPIGPVQAVLVHGTTDRVQPWAGRRAGGLTWPSYVSVLATVHAWVTADHAVTPVESILVARPAPSPAGATPPGRGPVPAGPTRPAGSPVPPRTPVVEDIPMASGVVGVMTWAPGPSGAGVVLYTVHGMGHRWPVTSPAAAGTPNDTLEPLDATTVVVATAASVTRQGRRAALM